MFTFLYGIIDKEEPIISPVGLIVVFNQGKSFKLASVISIPLMVKTVYNS